MSGVLPEQATVPTAAAMRALGGRLAGTLRAGDLVLLTGPLGAGKTTLVQGLGEALGVRGQVTSPTFVIARVHPSLAGGPALVHVDAYRLGGMAELDDLDLDLEGSVTVVEWGGGLAEGLSADRLEITIAFATDERGAADERGGGGPRRAGGESGGGGELWAGGEAGRADEPRTVRITGAGPRWTGAKPLDRGEADVAGTHDARRG